MDRFDLVPGESKVFVRASTSLNTITMAASEVAGFLDAETTPNGVFLAATVPSCRVELPVSGLRSGNPLFDREGRHRFEAGRYPFIAAELVTAIPLGRGQYRVRWRVTFHGATRDLDGDLVARRVDAHSISVESENQFDVRDWGVQPGRFIGIRVYPEATFAVRLLYERRHRGSVRSPLANRLTAAPNSAALGHLASASARDTRQVAARRVEPTPPPSDDLLNGGSHPMDRVEAMFDDPEPEARTIIDEQIAVIHRSPLDRIRALPMRGAPNPQPVRARGLLSLDPPIWSVDAG